MKSLIKKTSCDIPDVDDRAHRIGKGHNAKK